MSGETDRKKRSTDEYGRPLTLTEKIKNVCIAIGALSALILGIVANSRGEPVAEKTWETLRDKLNAQSEVLKRLYSRVVYLQAHEEGRHAADLQLKLDALQKKYDDLKVDKPKKVTVATPTKPECRTGFIEAGGRCRKATTAIVKRVEKEASAAKAAKKRLVEEKRRAAKLEKRVKHLQRQEQKKGIPELSPLPKKLDDVADK
jgi:hypothetical protein